MHIIVLTERRQTLLNAYDCAAEANLQRLHTVWPQLDDILDKHYGDSGKTMSAGGWGGKRNSGAQRMFRQRHYSVSVTPLPLYTHVITTLSRLEECTALSVRLHGNYRLRLTMESQCGPTDCNQYTAPGGTESCVWRWRRGKYMGILCTFCLIFF